MFSFVVKYWIIVPPWPQTTFWFKPSKRNSHFAQIPKNFKKPTALISNNESFFCKSKHLYDVLNEEILYENHILNYGRGLGPHVKNLFEF